MNFISRTSSYHGADDTISKLNSPPVEIANLEKHLGRNLTTALDFRIQAWLRGTDPGENAETVGIDIVDSDAFLSDCRL